METQANMETYPDWSLGGVLSNVQAMWQRVLGDVFVIYERCQSDV